MDEIINKLIPADDLYWSEEDKKYTCISDEECVEIIQACLVQGITDEESVMKVINWAIFVKTGQILLKNFLSNQISIVDFLDDEPRFGVKNL